MAESNAIVVSNNLLGYRITDDLIELAIGGALQLFLVPYVNKGMRVDYEGGMYPEKTGSYFVQSVQGEFGMSGGRQTVQLGFIMN